MTPPRHLWSGDWRRESAAAAEQVAERRGRSDAPVDPPPVARPSARTSPLHRALAALPKTSGHDLRRATLIGLASLLCAGAAYAGVSALLTSGPQTSTGGPPSSRFAGAGQSASVGSGPAWLGVQSTSFPLTSGALIVDVAPGGPAEAAGLQPGDVITEIDGHPVQAPADIDSALAGLHPGQRVQIVYQQGPSTYTASVTLQGPPSGP
jgi:hypothetical protein